MGKWLEMLKTESSDISGFEIPDGITTTPTEPEKAKITRLKLDVPRPVSETVTVAVKSELQLKSKELHSLLAFDEELKIRAWMEHLGETSELLINEYLEKCRIDHDAKQYFLKRSEEIHHTISNPEKVTCRFCQHFKADEIGDGSGIGDCIAKAPASRKTLMWLNSARYYTDYQANTSVVN